jgi:hypothetical protein
VGKTLEHIFRTRGYDRLRMVLMSFVETRPNKEGVGRPGDLGRLRRASCLSGLVRRYVAAGHGRHRSRRTIRTYLRQPPAGAATAGHGRVDIREDAYPPRGPGADGGVAFLERLRLTAVVADCAGTQDVQQV